MNSQIWKFEQLGSQLSTGTIVISMPKGAEVLSIAIQKHSGLPAMWAMVDPDEHERVEHKFFIVWTGRDFSSKGLGRFLATIQLSGMVWHIFDVGE